MFVCYLSRSEGLHKGYNYAYMHHNLVFFFVASPRVHRGTTRHPGYPLAYQLSRRARVACLRVSLGRRRAAE